MKQTLGRIEMNEVTDPALRQSFLEGMSHVASTVNIITTDGPEGRAGVTVSAMSSVSPDTPKPSLLVCVHHLSPAAEKIVNNGVFCVNVLSDQQSHISDTFAGRRPTDDGDKFSCADWAAMSTGSPRIIDPLVAFDCKVTSSDRIGTHHIFIGEVEETFKAEQGSPLIFANRAYGAANRIDTIASTPSENSQPSHTVTVGCFHTFGPFLVPALLAKLARQERSIDIKLMEGDQRTIIGGLLSGDAEVGLLYDVNLDDQLETENLTAIEPYVLLAEGHPLTKKLELSIADLEDEPMVLLDSPPSKDYFLSLFDQVEWQPKVAHTSASFEMVRGMVGHGLGYSLLATKPASGMTYDGKALAARPLTDVLAQSKVVLAKKAGVQLSPEAQAFADFCRGSFAG